MSTNLKQSIRNYLATTAAGILSLLAVAVFVPFVSEFASAGTDIAGSTSGYYVSVSSADTLALHLNATPGGTIGSVQDTLTVSSNTPNGYKVYISSPTSSTGSNYLCPAGVTPSTSACFTPTSSADSLLALTTNSWGYSLNGFSYNPVPLLGSEDEIISKTTATSESGTTMPIYFGVKADMAMSGSYTGQVMYTAIADTSGTTRLTTISPAITENIDGGDTLTTTIPYTSSRTTDEIKAGLTIGIGGSTTNGGTSCPVSTVTKITSPYSGLQVTCTMPAKDAGSYNVVATVTLPQGSTRDFTATSQLTYEDPIKDITKLASLQDMANHPEYCANTETGVTALLTDARDDKQYRIRKLKDGKCWMIDNLRLGNAGEDLTLTSADSNVASTKTIPAAQIVNSGGTRWDNASSTTQAQYQDYHIYVRDDATFTETTDTQGTYYEVSGDDYGNLYNWWTATAGSGVYNTSQGTNVSESICPKGWILPQNAEGAGSFYTLYQGYNSQSLMTTIAAKNSTVADRGPEFKLAGYYDGGVVVDVGSGGYYWSRTAYGGYYGFYVAYSLSLNTSSVDPQRYGAQYGGFSVRCVSVPSVSELEYLQDIESANTEAMEVGETVLLKDRRDEKEYRVRKLKDGQLWMIDNLRLGNAGEALALTSADSNVNSTKTIPAAQIVSSGSTAWDNGSNTTQAQYQTYHIYVRDDATFTETTDNKGAYYEVSGNDYGNLYNWWTATAGSGVHTTSPGANVSESICPKGWILPQNAEGTGSFKTLSNSYNSQSLMTTVAAKNSTVADRGPEFKLAGLYYGGVSKVGSEGNYWSRTANDSVSGFYYAYYLYLTTSSVNPQGRSFQYVGFSVRCIAS